jgi:hypothetical protein
MAEIDRISRDTEWINLGLWSVIGHLQRLLIKGIRHHFADLSILNTVS